MKNSWGAGGNYDWAFHDLERFIAPAEIQLVAEIGSRDALDGLELARHFSAEVLIFEPDPINAEICRANLALQSGQMNVQFFELALSNVSGTVDFYSVDPKLYANRGSSGLREISFDGRPPGDPDRNRDSVQKKVRVGASRFDELGLPAPDLVAMDAEGSELQVLEGFGDQLRDVRAVVAESSFWNNFHGPDSTFPKLHRLLSSNGFVFIAATQNPDRHKFPRQSFKRRFFPSYQPAFNVLYVNRGAQ
jgi:FkbM family methyltransferase